MNLIYEKWVPVRLADGTPDKIAPYEITREIENEKRRIVAVGSPRPDFDGALTQFLIGLLQTACTPETDEKWWDWRYEKAPKPDELNKYFDQFKESFVFEGKGPRFMQDFQPNKLNEFRDIETLLIGTPGKSTTDKNIDHFSKRKTINYLCSHCSVTALYTLQLNASGGGSGYRTGIRGGGPLTTLVLGETLWDTCWLNVLVRSNYLKGRVHKSDAPDRFPWLAPTRTSEKKTGCVTCPDDVHPDQQFWAMPCRISLNAPESGCCDICGTDELPVYRSYRTKNYGVNYQGAFEHPLSPYSKSEKGLLPIHPQPGGIGYREWLGFVENISFENNERRPARTVEQFRTICGKEARDGRLWAFGYDFVSGQANVRCWYDARMPILYINPSLNQLLTEHVGNMIKAARHVSSLVLASFFKATMMEPEKRDGQFVEWKWPKSLLNRLKTSPSEKSDAIKKKLVDSVEEFEKRVEKNLISLPISIRQQFWSLTEKGFYEQLYIMRNTLVSGTNENKVLSDWLNILQKTALSLFDVYSQDGDYDAVGPRSVAIARNELRKALYGNDLSVKKLGLPKLDDTEGGPDDGEKEEIPISSTEK